MASVAHLIKGLLASPTTASIIPQQPGLAPRLQRPAPASSAAAGPSASAAFAGVGVNTRAIEHTAQVIELRQLLETLFSDILGSLARDPGPPIS
jgi:hypothetical protein